MRKFIFNTTLLHAVTNGWGTIQATRHGRRDWKLVLMWVAWIATIAVAIGTIADEATDDD